MADIDGMELAKNQQALLHQLKIRGPQSVKILAKQLGMTTMGVRQHLDQLQTRGLVNQTPEARQTRGRPVHLWKLTAAGHARFTDRHSQLTVELIHTVREKYGEPSLHQLIDSYADQINNSYASRMQQTGTDLQERVNNLVLLLSEDGFMAELRLLPDGWLLIENHCPICAAATACSRFCDAELDTIQHFLLGQATVQRVDHLLKGARRCAYKITPL